MADNTTFQSSTLASPPANLVVATDSIGGVDYQRVKLTIGADGTATDVSAGSGANGTGVVRVTVATDDTLVASLATKLDTVAADIVTSTLPTGAGTAAAAGRVTLASDDPAVTQLNKFGTGYYVAVAASQTDAVIQSSTGATGDFLAGVLVIPATTAPGVVTIKDSATALISYPGGGTTALLTLTPFYIPVNAVSRSGAWKVTTGANVSILAMGKFS